MKIAHFGLMSPYISTLFKAMHCTFIPLAHTVWSEKCLGCESTDNFVLTGSMGVKCTSLFT